VGAYYYPWYGNDFHKGSPYLRDELSVKQRPVLGQYDDTDPAVIAQHLRWSKQANIQLWVTSWWRPGGREDNTTLNVILPHQDLGSHKIALLYETNGRVREPYYTTELVGPDMVHMCKNYFAHPNYYQIDGRPVIFVYVSRRFSELGMLEEVLLLMRSAAADYGFNPYIIGDQVWRTAPTGDYAPFSQLDAVTNYDVRGGMNLPDGTNYVLQSGVDNYYSEQAKWKAAANAQGCAYVPPAVPGYNDRAIRLAIDKAAVSRRLTPDGEEGSLFRASLKRARSLVDARTDNLMMINSFNEWHEDSQIEPTSGGSETNSPFNLTQGVEYEAYGELYLYILREETM
jgi:glycoprotein endo-alpha-1,2-mannosidase